MKATSPLCAAALALCLLSGLAGAQTRPAPDREQLERKLTSTATLIESSSGAKQIEASRVPEAATQRVKARELHEQARQAFAAGDLEKTAGLLDASARTMFEAVRLAAPAQVTEGKQRADYQARRDATQALIEAQKRISVEKGGPGAAEPARQAEALLAEADRMAAAGQLVQARRTLDHAYLTVKVAIGNQREGDTLVRSLSFATAADEYAYEIDRNETHRMLVHLLLKDRGVDTNVQQALATAARLRAQAEGEAARSDHRGAIHTLEDSTRELVKAIRAAGVYIPG